MKHFAVSALLLALTASGPLPVPASSETDEAVPALPFDPLGELVVVTSRARWMGLARSEGPEADLDRDLARLLAQDMGIPVRFVEVPTQAAVLEALRRGEAHFAAAQLSAAGPQADEFVFGPPYLQSRQIVIRGPDTPPTAGLAALDGRRVALARGSSAEWRLESVHARRGEIQWESVHEDHPEAAIAAVVEGRADYAVTGAHHFDLVRAAFPDLSRVTSLGGAEPIAWAFPRNSDPTLLRRVKRFFHRIAGDGTLRQVLDRHLGHAHRLDRAESEEFVDAVRTRLPALLPAFRRAGKATGIDWRFLAALAFQESKWDAEALSPTGVRGLMMLTEETAERMGVRDRTDPSQSILGGARYFRSLRDTLSERIPDPDRTWIALAAYNQGLGHLEDARKLAQRLGLDPDVWIDVRQALPLLGDESHYSTLKHGYARGGEAVHLAENVRAYYAALTHLMPLESGMVQVTARRSAEDFAAPGARGEELLYVF